MKRPVPRAPTVNRPRPTIILTFLALSGLAGPAAAPASAQPGRYTQRAMARGDVTDTAPKLDTWAYFDDSKPTPLGMTLLVDTLAARHSLSGRLLPLRVGLGYEGEGPALPVRPWMFELSWPGGSTRGLPHEELRSVSGWQSTVRHHRRLLAGRPRPYDATNATILSVRFYPDPSSSIWRSEDVRISPGSAFVDLVYFRLPEDVDPWTVRFVLSHVPSAEAPASVAAQEARRAESRPPPPPFTGASASAAFRVERDPELHQRAFRRTRRSTR